VDTGVRPARGGEVTVEAKVTEDVAGGNGLEAAGGSVVKLKRASRSLLRLLCGFGIPPRDTG
jgi:hypothetical protein